MKNDEKTFLVIIIVSIVFGLFCGFITEATNIISNILIGLGVFFLSFFSLTSAFMKG